MGKKREWYLMIMVHLKEMDQDEAEATSTDIVKDLQLRNAGPQVIVVPLEEGDLTAVPDDEDLDEGGNEEVNPTK